jgi:uncharacterized protein (TIGR02647 family)
MTYTADVIAELELLNQFNLANSLEGLKIHNSAEAATIAAARRLHEKGLTTLHDGGYLTSLGLEAARHAQSVLTILTPATA